MDEQLEMMVKGRELKHLMESRSTQLRKECGLKRMEVEVLYFLSVSREQNTSVDICHYLKANKGHISQTMDSLCRQHYLDAVPDQKDRRYVHYLMTEDAQAVVDRLREDWIDMYQQLFAGVSEEEMETYRRISLKIRENMEKILEK